MSSIVPSAEFDAVVVGAGFAGLYALHRLREAGKAVILFEAGDDVGGTWYWNRYPGCRCDVQSTEYQFGFSEEIASGWTWTERYATQPEILRYLQYVADALDLRPDIRLQTRVTGMRFDEHEAIWHVTVDGGNTVRTRHCIMATGCLSAANLPDIPGLETFGGDWHHTGDWPRETVDFSNRRVAVIGTGSSGIQVIPEIARDAAHLYVFQRTPSFTLPAGNRPLDPAVARERQKQLIEDRKRARETYTGMTSVTRNDKSALEVDETDREREFSERWQLGGFAFFNAYNDLFRSEDANRLASDFARAQMRKRIADPRIAEIALPTTYPAGAKRPCLDTGYLEALGQPNVTLVDARDTPVERITKEGIVAGSRTYPVDSIVFATGFDALTGSLTRIDIRGRGGKTLRDHWEAGARTYLGIASAGFPNMFFVAGPGSPSVISNVPVSIEVHVDWIVDCLAYMDAHGQDLIEANDKAEADWVQHVNDLASDTLYLRAASWYLGANVPGKPRVFMPYLGGVASYGERLARIAGDGYFGFELARAPDRPVADAARA